MRIEYRNPGYEHSINSIMLFQTDDQTPYWSDALLYFYPQIEKKELSKRNLIDRRQYVYEKLYDSIIRRLDEK